MGIKVQLKDGVVEVGGDFRSALEFVKSFKGRRYDRDTKTWTVPVTFKEFDKRNYSYPMDILSGDGSRRGGTGNHHTKWGNVYNREEWDAQKASLDEERKIRNKYAGEYEANKKWLRGQLRKVGLDERAVNYVAARIWDFEGEVESGRIKFSSPERREQVCAIIEQYNARLVEIAQREDDEICAAQERIWETARESAGLL